MNGSPYSGASLRLATWQFLTGKVASAALTFAVLLLVVRVLTVKQYVVYAVLTASVELGVGISGLGLPWLAGRFIPEFRLDAPGARLKSLVDRLLRWVLASLLIITVICLGLLDLGLSWAGQAQVRDAALIYVFVFLVEGVRRFLLISMLEPLMQQSLARAAQVFKQLLLLALLISTAIWGHVELIDVARFELAASIFSCAIGFVGLRRHVETLRSQPGRPSWQEPGIPEMWHMALQMYGSQLLSMAYSPQVFLLLVVKLLGDEAAALFGFLRNLYDTIARYLPASLLFGLIRPKLVASYLGNGGALELAANANLTGKLSHFVLMPILALSAAVGAHLVEWLSGARFVGTGAIFFGFLLALVPYSQRQLLESMAVSIGRSRLCLLGGLAGVAVVPVVLVLVHLGLGLWAPMIALLLAQAMSNTVIMLGLRRAIDYRPDLWALLKLGLAAGVGYAVVWALPAPPSRPLELVEAVLAVTSVYLLVAWLLKPFTVSERKRINGLLPRPLFVW